MHETEANFTAREAEAALVLSPLNIDVSIPESFKTQRIQREIVDLLKHGDAVFETTRTNNLQMNG